tara:strand:+ start:256 stop:1938 length:1683 start_codon:yes stop_codon:yes gene_type:complete
MSIRTTKYPNLVSGNYYRLKDLVIEEILDEDEAEELGLPKPVEGTEEGYFYVSKYDSEKDRWKVKYINLETLLENDIITYDSERDKFKSGKEERNNIENIKNKTLKNTNNEYVRLTLKDILSEVIKQYMGKGKTIRSLNQVDINSSYVKKYNQPYTDETILEPLNLAESTGDLGMPYTDEEQKQVERELQSKVKEPFLSYGYFRNYNALYLIFDLMTRKRELELKGKIKKYKNYTTNEQVYDKIKETTGELDRYYDDLEAIQEDEDINEEDKAGDMLIMTQIQALIALALIGNLTTNTVFKDIISGVVKDTEKARQGLSTNEKEVLDKLKEDKRNRGLDFGDEDDDELQVENIDEHLLRELSLIKYNMTLIKNYKALATSTLLLQFGRDLNYVKVRYLERIINKIILDFKEFITNEDNSFLGILSREEVLKIFNKYVKLLTSSMTNKQISEQLSKDSKIIGKQVETMEQDKVKQTKQPNFKMKDAFSYINNYKEWKKNQLGITPSKSLPTDKFESGKKEDGFKNTESNYKKSPWFDYIGNNMYVVDNEERKRITNYLSKK